MGIDWREKGAVTQVKDQGRCGSCWAFATAGTIEGQWAAAGNELKDVSVQQIVSCNVDDLGCSGGRVDTALRWMARTRSGNAEAEEQYPYVSASGTAPPLQIWHAGRLVRLQQMPGAPRIAWQFLQIVLPVFAVAMEQIHMSTLQPKSVAARMCPMMKIKCSRFLPRKVHLLWPSMRTSGHPTRVAL